MTTAFVLATIRAMERAGFYYFPFTPESGCGAAILDSSIDLKAFMADERNRTSEQDYVYTEHELQRLYGMVEYQRVVLTRAIERYQQSTKSKSTLAA